VQTPVHTGPASCRHYLLTEEYDPVPAEDSYMTHMHMGGGKPGDDFPEFGVESGTLIPKLSPRFSKMPVRIQQNTPFQTKYSFFGCWVGRRPNADWLRGPAVEHRSLAGVL